MSNPYEIWNQTAARLVNRRTFLAGVGVAGIAGLTDIALRTQLAFADTPPSATEKTAGRAPKVQPYASPSVVPAEEAEEKIKRVLIVVDYQGDFVNGGVFGTIEPAMAIEEALCEKIREYQDNDDIVIFTMDTHPSDGYEDTREGTFNPPHCIPGTEGWEIYGRARELLTPEKAIRVLKGTYGSRDLPFVLQMLQSQGVTIEYVEFAGVSTTCRVLHNAILVYNFFPELPIVFDSGTTASYTDERTREQLEELQGWGFIVKWR